MRNERARADNEQNLLPTPCWAAIQNSLENLELDLDSIDRYRDITDPQRALLETIRNLKDGGESHVTDPTSLRQTLSTFIDNEDLDEEMQGCVRSLDKNLEYAEWIVGDGLEGVNRRLAEMFEKAKKTDSSKEHLQEINRLLYTAINLFPRLTTGIEVNLASDIEQIEERTRQFEAKMGRRIYHYRHAFRLLEQAFGKEGQSVSRTMFFPLPYAFSTGSHGSGQRAAVAQSQEDIYFATDFSRGEEEIGLLEMVIDGYSITPNPSLVTLDEIDSIRFSTSANRFTPMVSRSREGPMTLSRGNPVTHYLRFRNFSGHRAWRNERELFPDLTFEEWEAGNQGVIEARFFTNLWQTTIDIDNLLERGFIAITAEESEDVILHELISIRIDKDDYVIAPYLLKRIASGEYGSDQVKTYRGLEIISRLSEFSIEERRF